LRLERREFVLRCLQLRAQLVDLCLVLLNARAATRRGEQQRNEDGPVPSNESTDRRSLAVRG
jgi:hypothetical protein